ncbi:MAG: IS5 family transposase [Thermomicrobiales bacterium]
MARSVLTDEQWDRVSDLFPGPAATGRPPADRRMIVDGILWILRTGSPWRDLPEEFGPWQTVWRLFDQWNVDGALQEVLTRLRAEQIKNADDLWCVDSTIVRAARCASGGGKKGIRKNRLITH